MPLALGEFGLLGGIVLSLAIGGLIGLEREHSKKQTYLGLRTFAFISLLGTLLTELSLDYYLVAAAIGLVGVFTITLFYYFSSSSPAKQSLGLTTAVMLPLVYVFGCMISLGYALEAVATAILVAYFLIEKSEVHHLVELISKRELVDGLTFLIIAFVIYPLIPATPLQYMGQTISLQSFVLTVILVSFISFASHIILKFLKRNAILYAAFLGGAISSIATVSLFAKDKKLNFHAFRLSFTSATAGSLVRSAIIVGALNPTLLVYAIPLFLVPLFASYYLTRRYAASAPIDALAVKYDKPLSLTYVIKFSLILLAVTLLVNAAFSMKVPLLLYLLFILGGIVSSISIAATAATLSLSNAVSLQVALAALCLACIGSELAKLALISNSSQSWHSNPKIVEMTGILVAATVAGFALSLALAGVLTA